MRPADGQLPQTPQSPLPLSLQRPLASVSRSHRSAPLRPRSRWPARRTIPRRSPPIRRCSPSPPIWGRCRGPPPRRCCCCRRPPSRRCPSASGSPLCTAPPPIGGSPVARHPPRLRLTPPPSSPSADRPTAAKWDAAVVACRRRSSAPASPRSSTTGSSTGSCRKWVTRLALSLGALDTGATPRPSTRAVTADCRHLFVTQIGRCRWTVSGRRWTSEFVCT